MLKALVKLESAEVVGLVKKLAKQHHSAALAQLASRIGSVIRYGAAGGDDVFSLVGSDRHAQAVIAIGVIGCD